MNTIFIDSQSRLWIGGNGVCVIDLENSRNTYECIYYQHKLDDPESKINERSLVYSKLKREIYLGSLGNGIYLLEDNGNNEKYTFKNYAVRCGLSDTSISNILDDENGNLWISTLKGIYFFDINTKRAFQVRRRRRGCWYPNSIKDPVVRPSITTCYWELSMVS